MMDVPTEKQLDHLRHMLGINDPSKRDPEPYRNYAAVNPGDCEYTQMAAAGWVELYRSAGNGSSYDYFACTEEGIRLAKASFYKRRQPAAKRRYSAFLDARDVDPDLTFRQFLSAPEWADARARA